MIFCDAILVVAADLCGQQPDARYHKTKHPAAPDEPAAGVCGPYGGLGRTEKFMSVFEQIKQGLEEAVAYENEVYEKLREAEQEAESTTKRFTHEEIMEAAWTRIRVFERNE